MDTSTPKKADVWYRFQPLGAAQELILKKAGDISLPMASLCHNLEKGLNFTSQPSGRKCRSCGRLEGTSLCSQTPRDRSGPGSIPPTPFQCSPTTQRTFACCWKSQPFYLFASSFGVVVWLDSCDFQQQVELLFPPDLSSPCIQ